MSFGYVVACVRLLVFAFVEVGRFDLSVIRHGNAVQSHATDYERLCSDNSREDTGLQGLSGVRLWVCVTGCFTSGLKCFFFQGSKTPCCETSYFFRGETPCLGFDGGMDLVNV